VLSITIPEKKEITFYWNKQPLKAKKGEMIASALFANGFRIFGHHPKDGSAQGIFCANGQCARCTVIADGVPVKSCMTEVTENMFVQSLEGLPKLPDVREKPHLGEIENIETDVLIIGGGPGGITFANNLKNLKPEDIYGFFPIFQADSA
jgi:sarcosine oxidase subunit alpha